MDVTENLTNKNIEDGENLIKESLKALFCHNYSGAYETILNAQKLFTSEKSGKHISICLSLIGLLEYYKSNKYIRAWTYINYARYLSNFSQTQTAVIINKIASGDIYLSEKNVETALADYEKAKNIAKKKDEYSLLEEIEKRISS